MKACVIAMMLAGTSAAFGQFSDNFDGENGGVALLNFGGFANWTVSDGTVDLIGNGGFDLLPGNGLYVDLDGSTFNSGVLRSVGILLNPGTYELRFDLAGSQRGDVNTVNVALEGTAWTDSYTLNSSAPFLTYASGVFAVAVPTTVNIRFENLGGDQSGALLDNVRIVPAPGALALAGAAGLMAGRRRRSSARSPRISA